MIFHLPYSGRGHAEHRPGAPALQLDDLTISYPGVATPALSNATITITPGTRAALVGANGSGKSTLLKAVAGLLRPQSGTIRIYGHPVGACHHRVAYLPQRSEIDWRFPVTVERMVLAGRYVHLGWLRRPGRRDHTIVAAMLERLGIAELAQRQISRLSGGQQQRVLLARALAQEADLLLLDEPLNAVDAASRDVIAGVLDEFRRAGKTALVATHHIDRLDEEFDTIFTLHEGRLTFQPHSFAALEVL